MSISLLSTGIAVASFDIGAADVFSVSSDRIFPAARTTAAWSVSDAADGSAADASATTAAADGSVLTTGNWDTSFGGSRYVDFAFDAPLPGGLPIGGASFNFDFAANGPGDAVCFYVEVYRASDSSLLGTHGSSGSPIACTTGTTVTHTATALAELSSSDIANDLRVRVYADNSGSGGTNIDLATVTGTAYAPFTLFATGVGDRSTGTLATTPWALAAAGDGAVLTSGGDWASSFAAGRYVTFAFADEAPTAATVTAASFTLAYRAGTAASDSCWYLEVYDSGNTLIGTHGSSGSPISCNASASSWQTDTVPLPEIDAGTKLNSLKLKVFFKTSGPGAVAFDLARLSETYSLGTS